MVQTFEAMKKVVIDDCTINSNNVFDNTSGIDFDEVYIDYDFTPLPN